MNLLKKKIKVILADDHEIFRVGLAFLFSATDDIELAGEATGGQELVNLATSTYCDIIITDHLMPDMTGLEAVQLIRKKRPEIKSILLTQMEDSQLLKESKDLEINGYLLKSQVKDKVVEAIRKIINEKKYIYPENNDLDTGRSKISSNPFNLTEKELELLRWLALGLSYKQIAEKMNISVKTVEFHRSGITEKLGKRSIADLTRLAITWGVIREGEKAT
ncbi:MAG: response regulator transcription factor [Spirochaetia bacterium]|nr:response regulator transcription factor [Spirochaetia bacterium]